MSWRLRRQLFIVFILCLFFGSLVGLYYYFNVRVPISCTDGIKNQGEIDVDCGGPCVKICASEVKDLSVEWVRPFKISDGKYDVAAMMVNRNNLFGISKFNYRFTLFDDKNVHVAEKTGTIFINPNEKVLITESGLDTGKRVVSRAFLEYSEDRLEQGWVRTEETSDKPKLLVGNEKVTAGPNPKISAEITNDSPYDISNINVAIAVYDKDGNAIAVSSTYLDRINKGTTENIVFTWPEAFSSEWKSYDILPRADYTLSGNN
ncbi:MAG: hypothetical protein WCO84_05190 [bacterium]